MTVARRVAANSLAVWAASYATLAGNFIVGIFFFRWMPIAAAESYQAVYAYINLFAIVADFGVDYVLLREYTRAPEQRGRILYNGLLLKAGLGALAAILCAATASVADLAPGVRPLVWFFSLSLPLVIWSVFTVPFRAEARNVPPTMIAAGMSGVSLALKLALAAWFPEVRWFLVAAIGVELCKTAALYGYYRSASLVRMDMRLDWPFLRRLAAVCLPVGLYSVCNTINLRVDQAMLASTPGLTVGTLANYAVAVMVADLLMNATGALSTITMPILAGADAGDAARFRRLNDRVVKVHAAMACPVALFIGLYAPQILYLFYGDKYILAVQALPWLILAVLINSFYSLIFNLLFAVQEERRLLLFGMAAAALNLILNLLWIPRHGMMGAVYATLASYAANLLCTLTIARARELYWRWWPRHLLALAVAALLILPVKWADLPDAVLLISAALYLPVLRGVGYLNREDVDTLRSLLPRTG